MTTAIPSAATSPPPRRSWFRLRFSLRTLLILTTLCGVGMAYGVKVWKRYRAIVAIEENGSIDFGRGFDDYSGWKKHPLIRSVRDRVKSVSVIPKCNLDFERISDLGPISNLTVMILDLDMVIKSNHVAALIRHGGPKHLTVAFGRKEEDALDELSHGRKIEALGIVADSISENDVRIISQLPNLKTLSLYGNIPTEAIRMLDEIADNTHVMIETPIESKSQFDAIIGSRRIKTLKLSEQIIEPTWVAGTSKNSSITRLEIEGTVLHSLPTSRFDSLKQIRVTESLLGLPMLNRLSESIAERIELFNVEPVETEIVQFDWTRMSDRKLSFDTKGYSEVALTHILSQCSPFNIVFMPNSLTKQEFLRLQERCPQVENHWIPTQWREPMSISNTPPEPAP